jgi:hypothetical protein
MKFKFKGKIIDPYETFHWNASPSFFRGTLGGISRTIKCDDSLAILVIEDEDT